MRDQGVGVILTTPFFEPKHARVVAQQMGARIAAMAHQVGALPGTDDYLAFIDHNLRALARAALHCCPRPGSPAGRHPLWLQAIGNISPVDLELRRTKAA